MYSDNQTGHLYVINSGDKVKVSNLNGSDKFRIMITDNNDKGIYTTDILSKNLVLNSKLNTVNPIYYKKWTVNPMTSVVAGKTYSLYFYLENMYGFGLQDRWDLAAAYTAKDGDTIKIAMTALKENLDSKLNEAGPIKGDFKVSTTGSDNNTKIIVEENPASKTYDFTYIDILTHGRPNVYDVTLSTYDGEGLWGNNERRIREENTTTIRIAASKIVMDMEHYFARNRADLYDMTPNFGTNIINELRTNLNNTYVMLNVHYAFSDSQGYTYFSEKDLNIAIDVNNTDAMTELAKTFNVENNGFDSIGYIHDEESWKANYWRLADYFAAGNTANKESWNGDGWLIFNFPAGKYAGRTFAPKYDNAAMATVAMSGTTSYAIYSVTDATDMGAATPFTGDTLDELDMSKITYSTTPTV